MTTGSDSGLSSNSMDLLCTRIELLRQTVSTTRVIRSATLNGAEALKMEDEIGTVEVGKIADMILIETNPLENLKSLCERCRVTEDNEVVRVGGVKYTISKGVVYDAKGLLKEVKEMVDKAKAEEGFSLKQPGVK